MPLRALGVVRESVTLAHPTGIRSWGEFGFKLSLWRFTFLNYTKSTKSEALEKNAVSRRQIALPSILKYSFGFQKGPTLLGDLRLSAYGESGALKVLAEGEGAGVEPLPHRSAYSGELRRKSFLAQARLSRPYTTSFSESTALR